MIDVYGVSAQVAKANKHRAIQVGTIDGGICTP